MKKILIATTALVATAGMAAAELNIAGSARIGLGYVEDAEDAAGRDAEVRIEQRLRVNITGIAETDAGVKFEARFRLEAGEDGDNSISGNGPGAAGFAVSSGGLRLDVGNVSDVIDSGDVVNYYGFGVGFTAFLEYNENVFNNFSNFGIPAGGFGSGDASATTIKLRYTTGDFTVSASYSNDEDAADAANFNDVEEFQIGVGYNFGDYSVGALYGNVDGDVTVAGITTAIDTDFWAISFDGSLGNFDFAAQIVDSDVQDVSYGISVDYDISAATSIRFVISAGGGDEVTGAADDTSYGIGFTHSLGGGVTLAGGVGSNSTDQIVADLGVSFSF